MTRRSPGTPASKIERTPVSTPCETKDRAEKRAPESEGDATLIKGEEENVMCIKENVMEVKELQYQQLLLACQMEITIEELRHQGNLAQSQLNELRKKLYEDQQGSKPIATSRPLTKKCLSFSEPLSWIIDNKDPMSRKKTRNTIRQSSRVNRVLEVLQKEVACHRLGIEDAAETIAKLQSEIGDMLSIRPDSKQAEVGSVVAFNKGINVYLKDEITKFCCQKRAIANLEKQLENVQKSEDKLVMSRNSWRSSSAMRSIREDVKKLYSLHCEQHLILYMVQDMLHDLTMNYTKEKKRIKDE